MFVLLTVLLVLVVVYLADLATGRHLHKLIAGLLKTPEDSTGEGGTGEGVDRGPSGEGEGVDRGPPGEGEGVDRGPPGEGEGEHRGLRGKARQLQRHSQDANLPRVRAGRAILAHAAKSAAEVKWKPNVACPTGVCAGLGEGFDLRRLNTLNDPKVLLNGRSLFKDTGLGQCADYTSGGKNSKNLETVADTKDLVSKISTSLAIEGTLPIKTATAKASISSNTGYDATIHSDIKTSFLDLLVESGHVYFRNNDKCRGILNLNDAFLVDFRQLPAHIDAPRSEGTWATFNAFFNKWGTHVLNQIAYGSRLQQWESTVGTSSDIDKTLQAKACLDVEGPGKSFAANGCAGFSTEDREKASRTVTNSNSVIIGGSEETRVALQNGISQETIEAFLRSSAESNQGVSMQFTPLWSLLSLYFSGACIKTDTNSPPCLDLQRSLNLEAAFAFNALRCNFLESGGKTFQEFRALPAAGGVVTYACYSRKTGCSDDDDCHYNAGKAGCQSGGPTAFDTGAVFGDPAEGLFRTTVRGETREGIRDGINNSCSYHAFKGCTCDTSWAGGLPDRYLWKQGMS